MGDIQLAREVLRLFAEDGDISEGADLASLRILDPEAGPESMRELEGVVRDGVITNEETRYLRALRGGRAGHATTARLFSDRFIQEIRGNSASKPAKLFLEHFLQDSSGSLGPLEEFLSRRRASPTPLNLPDALVDGISARLIEITTTSTNPYEKRQALDCLRLFLFESVPDSISMELMSQSLSCFMANLNDAEPAVRRSALEGLNAALHIRLETDETPASRNYIRLRGEGLNALVREVQEGTDISFCSDALNGLYSSDSDLYLQSVNHLFDQLATGDERAAQRSFEIFRANLPLRGEGQERLRVLANANISPLNHARILALLNIYDHSASAGNRALILSTLSRATDMRVVNILLPLLEHMPSGDLRAHQDQVIAFLNRFRGRTSTIRRVNAQYNILRREFQPTDIERAEDARRANEDDYRPAYRPDYPALHDCVGENGRYIANECDNN